MCFITFYVMGKPYETDFQKMQIEGHAMGKFKRNVGGRWWIVILWIFEKRPKLRNLGGNESDTKFYSVNLIDQGIGKAFIVFVLLREE